jgi:DNA-binding CsgD family transcriptional regulator
VRDLPPNGLRIAADIGRIAAERGRVEDRANALLDALHRLVPFQAAAIRLIDVERYAQASAAARGYDATVTAYIDSKENIEELELLGFTRQRRAMRVQDLPIPKEQIRGWVDYLAPAGFRGGLAVGLFAEDGRHLGALGMNTDTAGHPTEAARDLIETLAPVIANAVDPMQSVGATARLVHDAQAGVVIDVESVVAVVPGLVSHPLLLAGSPVIAAARRHLAEGATYASFLSPYQLLDTGGPQHVRVTVLDSPVQPLHPRSAVVLISPAGDLHGLTRRELEVLGLIIEGWPNQRIAAVLVVADRTVAAHVEHILAKLAVTTRTLAAVRALRTGLYVPRELSVPLG